jgi:hypothetical protein
MKFSMSSDELVKTQENKQFELEFQADYDELKRRMNIYENNQVRAYAVIWERCTRGMRQKIESRVEFPQKIKNNPIELLRAGKGNIKNYQEHC